MKIISIYIKDYTRSGMLKSFYTFCEASFYPIKFKTTIKQLYLLFINNRNCFERFGFQPFLIK